MNLMLIAVLSDGYVLEVGVSMMVNRNETIHKFHEEGKSFNGIFIR